MVVCQQLKWQISKRDHNMAAVRIGTQANVQRIHDTQVIDIRNFSPHQAKEVELWSWKRLRNEKWIVFIDCKNNRIKMRKVS